MRRLILPILLIAVAAGAGFQAMRADSDSDPGQADAPAQPDVVVGSPLFSARRVPAWARQPVDDTLLGETAAATFTDPLVDGASKCLVVTRDGERVVDMSPQLLLTPASGQKLVTAAAALQEMSDDDTFRTEVVIAANPEIDENGTLVGDLFLIGGGDPVLSTPEYVDRYTEPRTHTDITTLADLVAAELADRGVTTVQGRVVGDESLYVIERDYVDDALTWKESFVTENQAGPLSALLLNDGFSAWSDDPQNRRGNTRASDPAANAAGVFDDLLTERGITITGAPTSGEAPEAIAERSSVGVIESPPVSAIVGRMLRFSDNTTAEMLFKDVGRRRVQTAERAVAALGVGLALEDAGHPLTGSTSEGDRQNIVTTDGSGLSSGNNITCDVLISILETAGPASVIADGLAVVGESGTLDECLDGSEADGDVLAKTGTLNDVTTLAGMTEADNGDLITFAMIVNKESLLLGLCNTLQQTLIEAVDGHPYGPSLRDLEPLAPVTN